MSIMMAGPKRKRYEGWREMFEPVRIRRKVHRPRRAVPYWTNGYDRVHGLALSEET